MKEGPRRPEPERPVASSAPRARSEPLTPSPRGSALHAGRVLDLQRLAGNRATAAVVQRDVETKEGILDNVHIKTYSDAAGFYTSHCQQLEAERAAVLGDSVPAPPELFNVAFEGRDLAKAMTAAGTEKIDAPSYDQLDAWFGRYSAAMTNGEAQRTLVAAQKMRAIAADAQGAAQRMLDTKAKLDDKLAGAFAASDDSPLSTLWSWGTALYDSALSAKPLVEGATAMEQELTVMARAALAQTGPNSRGAGPSYKVPEASKVLDVMEKANKFIATIQLVMAAADLATSQKTGQAKAKSVIKDSVGIASALGTLIGASASISLQLNLMIGPMTDACLTALGKLEDVAMKINKDLIAQGLYDKVNWDLMPGGRAVFDFMLAVRNAGDPSGVPTPVPGTVSSYFVDNRSELEAGTSGGGEAMPTTGYWFWRKVDNAKIAQWVFGHRDNLWAMFYGSTRPNSVG